MKRPRRLKGIGLPVSVCRVTELKHTTYKHRVYPVTATRTLYTITQYLKNMGVQIPLAAASKLCRNAY